MDTQRAAYGYALAAVGLWATVASAFKLALRGLAPLELVFWASLVSTVVLGAVALGRVGWRGVLGQPAWAWRRAAWMGVLNPFLYYLFLFSAYDRLPAQEAQPLNYTWPIVLALLAGPVLGQPVTRRALAALLISFSGILVIASRGQWSAPVPQDPAGVAFALGSAVLWAVFWLANMRDGRDPAVKLFGGFAFGTLYSLPAAWWAADGWPTPVDLAGAAYVGLFEMGITFLLWLEALRRSLRSAAVANVAFLTPFLSLVCIRFVVGETIRPSAVAGLVLIVAGLVIQARSGPRLTKP